MQMNNKCHKNDYLALLPTPTDGNKKQSSEKKSPPNEYTAQTVAKLRWLSLQIRFNQRYTFWRTSLMSSHLMMYDAHIVHEMTEVFLPQMFDREQAVLHAYSKFHGTITKTTRDYVNELVYVRCA